MQTRGPNLVGTCCWQSLPLALPPVGETTATPRSIHLANLLERTLMGSPDPPCKGGGRSAPPARNEAHHQPAPSQCGSLLLSTSAGVRSALYFCWRVLCSLLRLTCALPSTSAGVYCFLLLLTCALLSTSAGVCSAAYFRHIQRPAIVPGVDPGNTGTNGTSWYDGR